MPDCKLLLDENLCFVGERYDDMACEGLALELKSAGIDAVFVGQDVPGQRRFCKSNPDVFGEYQKVIDFCSSKFIKDRNAGIAPPVINQGFKNCFKKSLENIPTGPCNMFAGVPPRGTDDHDIRKFAEDTGRIIISRDAGPELESKGQTDRVALPFKTSPPSAQEILARLAGLGLCN